MKQPVNKFSVDMTIENFQESSIPQEVMERIRAKIDAHPLHTRKKCRIFYRGRNRNDSFIDEDVAEQLKSTLPNTPIVGEYWEVNDDFGTHGGEWKTDENGNLVFKRTTVPYGVVPADTEVWEELVTDKDGVERNYVCCETVLWNKRYPELQTLIDNDHPQSMEIDGETLEGSWVDMDGDYVFKYTKAYLSALCILGENIQPCFEGAAFVTFSLNSDAQNFKKECEEMLKDLNGQFSLNETQEKLDKVVPVEGKKMIIFTTGLNHQNKGGSFGMGAIKLQFASETDIRETLYKAINAFNAENDIYSFKYAITDVTENSATVFNYEDSTYYTIGYSIKGDVVTTEAPVKANVSFMSEAEITANKQAVSNYAILKADNAKLDKTIKELEAKLKDYQLTEAEYTALKESADKYEAISAEYAELKEYKVKSERTAKEEIFAKFNKLSEADVKAVKDKIDEYSAEEIDEKLSAIAFKKGISLVEPATVEEPKPVYSYTEIGDSAPTSSMSAPSWFNLVEEKERELNNLN